MSTPLLPRIRRQRRALVLAMAVMFTAAGQADAQIGFEASISKFHTPTWGTNPVEGTPLSAMVWDVVVHEPSSTAYLGGEFTSLAPTLSLAGAIDAASGLPQAGFPKLESGQVKVAAADGQGGWYVGGNFKISFQIPCPPGQSDPCTDSRQALARINADGSVDQQWKPELARQTAEPSTIWALAVHNSYVYVGGDFTRFQGGYPRNHIARLSATTGTVDAGWDPSPDGTVVRSIAVSPDGSMVYVAGDFTTIKGVARNGLAALASQGATVTPWTPPLANVNALAVAPDHSRIFVGGDSLAATDPAGNVVWNHAGQVRAVALSRTGATLYAGGAFTSLGGQPRNYLAAVDVASGTLDASWIPEANDPVSALTLSEDGSKVYLGGDFTQIRGHTRNRLAAINAQTGTLESWDPNAKDGTIVALSASGSQIYAGGTFGGLGAQAVTYAGAININTGEMVSGWKPLIQNLDANGEPEAEPPVVQALAMSEDASMIYLAGNFTHVNGQPRKHLAAVDRATGALVEGFHPGEPQGTIRALGVHGNRLFVGGDFKEVRVRNSIHGDDRPDNPCPAGQSDCAPANSGGTSSVWRRHGLIAAFDARTGHIDQNFDQTPESVGCGLIGQAGQDCGAGNGAVKTIVIDPIRGYLYASGTFSDLGGQLGMYAAQLSNGAFTPWQPDMDYPGFDLDLFKGDNLQTLFVAAGGAGGHVMAFKPHTGTEAAVWDRRFDGDAMAVDSSNTTVYTGGHYDFVDGGAYKRKHAAAFNLDGEIAVNWDPELDTSTGPFTLEVVPGRTVIYAGEFSRVNRRPQPGYAQFPPLPGQQP